MFELQLNQVSAAAVSSYGRAKVLDQISLTCSAGERVGLVGRNGSGKTTLARIVAGLQRPASGKIEKRPRHARIMLVLQRPEDHFAESTVQEQVASYARPRKKRPEIEAILKQVGLAPDVAGTPPLRLSSGQQRLVAIACALAADASLIILDEPMAGLDSPARYRVKEALIHLTGPRPPAVIVISHHPDDLLGLVSRLWVLEGGVLCYDGTLAEAPLSTLEGCFAADDLSLYLLMRRLESRGVTLPPSLYRESSAQTLVSALHSALEGS